MTILLVEDNPVVLQVLKGLLISEGHTVLSANNVDEAIKMLKICQLPNVVITDLIMPGRVQCAELIKYVRDDDPEMPVIVISGHPLDRITDGMEIFDSVVLLKKPISRSALNKAIQQANALEVT